MLLRVCCGCVEKKMEKHTRVQFHPLRSSPPFTVATVFCMWDWTVDVIRCAKFQMNQFWVFRLDALALSVIATATWLAGWVAGCHTPYCIKTAKPIGKLFRPSESPIILVF